VNARAPTLGAVSTTEWPEARLHVVTGKGGAGKTTVAAALALALAAGGRRTLVVEVEGAAGPGPALRHPTAAVRGAPDRLGPRRR
jgi:UDP-N-acetylmuramyl tripeptide synthase